MRFATGRVRLCLSALWLESALNRPVSDGRISGLKLDASPGDSGHYDGVSPQLGGTEWVVDCV